MKKNDRWELSEIHRFFVSYKLSTIMRDKFTFSVSMHGVEIDCVSLLFFF